MEPHTGFIVAAFAVTGLVLGLTIAATFVDYRVQLAALARLSGRRIPLTSQPEEDAP